MCVMPESLALSLALRIGRRQVGCGPGLPGQCQLVPVVSGSCHIGLAFYAESKNWTIYSVLISTEEVLFVWLFSVEGKKQAVS